MPHALFRSRIDVPARSLFDWHTRPGAFLRLNPPWDPVTLLERRGSIRDGDISTIRMHIGPLHKDWVARHHDYIEGSQFRDTQTTGPFARWTHTHRFEPLDSAASILHDEIDYALPMGTVGSILAGSMTRRRLDALFAFRHHTTRHDLLAHHRHPTQPLRIAVTGSTGFVGSPLVAMLTSGGHHVLHLTRHRDKAALPDHAFFDGLTGQLDPKALDGVDAVIHLAGANIAAGRWTAERKRQLRNSRVVGTAALAHAIASLDRKPRVFITASGIGIYGDRGDQVVTESSAPGTGFLADLGVAWEHATLPAIQAGVRVVHARIGVVLSPEGGALAKMLTPFKLGVGGPVGSGQQFWSWISRDDLVGALHHALMTESIHGPMNAVSPDAPTNRQFTKALAHVLRRPAFLAAPAPALRLMLGEMADEALLVSTRAQPTVLQNSGYVFRDPDLSAALTLMLGRARFADLPEAVREEQAV
jgi:uncharacterized protein (TIGR01777 family)